MKDQMMAHKFLLSLSFCALIAGMGMVRSAVADPLVQQQADSSKITDSSRQAAGSQNKQAGEPGAGGQADENGGDLSQFKDDGAGNLSYFNMLLQVGVFRDNWAPIFDKMFSSTVDQGADPDTAFRYAFQNTAKQAIEGISNDYNNNPDQANKIWGQAKDGASSGPVQFLAWSLTGIDLYASSLESGYADILQGLADSGGDTSQINFESLYKDVAGFQADNGKASDPQQYAGEIEQPQTGDPNVPEPASLLLVAFGVAAIFGVRRFMRRRTV